MRVIAGSARGIRLTAPPGRDVRPTPDRAKEALMSALGGFFAGQSVLDLCAGSGAVGIELLSRGCGRAHFVEPSAAAIGALRQNLDKARFADIATVTQTTAQRAIHELAQAGEQFDFVFVDPPWQQQLQASLVQAIVGANLVSDNGELIVERDGSQPELPAPDGWQVSWARKYGRCALQRMVRHA